MTKELNQKNRHKEEMEEITFRFSNHYTKGIRDPFCPEWCKAFDGFIGGYKTKKSLKGIKI